MIQKVDKMTQWGSEAAVKPSGLNVEKEYKIPPSNQERGLDGRDANY